MIRRYVPDAKFLPTRISMISNKSVEDIRYLKDVVM